MSLWSRCVQRLESEIPETSVNTYIRPLYAQESNEGVDLLAPNELVRIRVDADYLPRIKDIISDLTDGTVTRLTLRVGDADEPAPAPARPAAVNERWRNSSKLDPRYTFDSFVQGKSNQIAAAAAAQVADKPGESYNPLLIYGGVGLGKTHLMHAIGNCILANNPRAQVMYLHSERFVNDMVKAIQHNTMDEFKNFYRSVDALLVDDIQFFADKQRSQEEFFHTFNALLEVKKQIILTCDRYPRELEGLEERLRNRFGWGLPVPVEPPELETRVAILMNKAEQAETELPQEVAFFVAQKIRSNVRDLESALHRLIAGSSFCGQPITLDFARSNLQDMLQVHDRMVTIENIQKTVCNYYNIRPQEMLSKRRTRSVARPRQVAMSLAKELTNHSLPEIGEAFGGRDHTTVIHACRKIRELVESDQRIREDYSSLQRSLQG